MMMETVYDPYELFFGDEQTSPTSDGLLFPNEIMFGNFNADSESISPISNTMDNTETDFDPATFDKLLNELLSSDPLTLKEPSIDFSFATFESEPSTREMGTDPMEPAPPTLPLIIKTNNVNQLTNAPIFLIKKISTTSTEPIPVTTEYYDLSFESSLPIANDYSMEDNLPITPSPSSDSHDEASSNSPGGSQDKIYSKLLTDLDNLPKTGSFALTNEEIKIMKQEGYPIPNKLPLSKNEEKLLKKVRRKIKNKISAQESRRKKKDYVNTLEKQIAKYLDENNALKERMTTIEKNQKSLTQERDLLRSMISKGTPAPSTALMVFAVFFAVLFGIWSPITSKSSIDDRSLSLENALTPSKNYQSAFTSQKSLLDQQENTHSNYVTDNYKSRVLLSADEYDHHHHGPYLPSNNKYKSIFQQQTAAPGYTYSNTVEKYMNKKIKSDQLTAETHNDQNFKRSFIDESPLIQPTYKKVRSNYHQNENIVVIEETEDESKSVKIIRVERTIPAIGNDTLKLAQRTINE